MYYYIVDPQKISPREFERVQNNLYSSLSEYRISGETARVTGLRTIQQLVDGAFQRGVKTLIAAGTDETLHEVINAVKGREVTLGFIPLVPTELGEILGLQNVTQAAKHIGLRRITELDLVAVNNNFFLSKLAFGSASLKPSGLFNFQGLQQLWELPVFQINFSADNGKFQGTLSAVGGIIVNCRTNSGVSGMFNPTDGVVDLITLPKLSKMKTIRHRRAIMAGEYEKIPGSSLVHVKQLEISMPSGLPLKSGEKVIARTPAKIEVLPKALKMIVGRERKF